MAPNLRALRGRVQAAFDALPRPAIAPLSFELEDAKTSRWTEPCLALACNNMSALYDEAGWGWSDDKKRAELAEPGMRLLVIRDGDTLAAFSSFLVDTEETAADDDSLCTVVYCYELQVDERYRRRGLGGVLMGALEGMAAALPVDKVMLTVFRCNTAAIAFYRQRSYLVDEISPSQTEEEDDEPAVYEIMSRATRSL